MSYCVQPYAVRIDDVKSLLGSNDLSLVPTLKSRFPRHFEDAGEDDELTQEAALADLLTGNELNPDYGHLYGYALEMLCWHAGELLTNRCWSAMRSDWFETVDDAISAAGIPYSLIGTIFFRGAPVKIPRPDDFPTIGYVLNSEIAPAIEALGKPLSGADGEIRKSVMEVRLWLATCRERRCDLVTFYA